MKRSRFVLLATALLCAAMLTPPALAQTESGSESMRRKARQLHDRYAAVIKDFNAPGMAVAVVYGNEVILVDSFGLRDTERKLPVTNDTMFYIASSTKSFVAMAITTLAEEGKLDIDAPVKRYLPRFELADPEATQKITLRDLLAHRPGLNSGPITTAEAYTGQIDDDKFYRLLREVKPRGQFAYTNLHYTLLGRVVHAVSGKSWQVYLRDKILRPAGMNRTVATATELWGDPNSAIPTDNIEEWRPVAIRKTDRTMHAAGGMAASANDLATWLLLNMNGGKVRGKQVIPAPVIQRMQENQVTVDRAFGPFQRDGYGLGWYIGRYKEKKNVHHFGGFEGSRAHVSFLPEERLGIAVVTNCQGILPEAVAADIYDQLLGLGGDDIVEQARQQWTAGRERALSRRLSGPNPVEAKTLSLSPRAYTGEYVHDNWGTATIRLQGGKLVGAAGDLPFDLFSRGTERFATVLAGDPAEGQFIIEGQRVVGLRLSLGAEAVLEFRRR